MGAPKSRAREVTRAVLLPTGAHGLVARPYEPLADSLPGTEGPTKPVPCSRFREHRQAPGGACLCTLLLDFDFRAGFLELLLEGLGVGLADAFLDGLGSAVDQILGLLQAQAGDFAHCLDRVDLVLTGGGEDH